MAKKGKPLNLVNTPLPETFFPDSGQNSSIPEEEAHQIFLKEIPPHDLRKLKNTDLKFNFILNKYKRANKNPRKTFKKTLLTRKQRNQLNLMKISKKGWNYENLQGLRDMWQDYIMKNLSLFEKIPNTNDQNWQNFSSVLAKSELVGSNLKVARSKVANQVGITGTVILETKMTFQIVTPASKLKILLKENSVFELQIPGMNLKLSFFGKHTATRPCERSVKKIKSLMCPDL